MALSAILLVFLVAVPGTVTFALINKISRQPKERSWSILESAFLVFFLGFLLVGFVSLFLASLGLFSIVALVLVLLAYSAFLVFCFKLNWHSVVFTTTGLNRNAALLDEVILLVLLLCVCTVFYDKPFEWVIGGRDPGVYFNTGVNIARTGSIVSYDEVIPSVLKDNVGSFSWGEQLNPNYVRADGDAQPMQFPGFYLADATSGRIEPQFVHLYTAWIALFVGLFGLNLGLYVTPFIGLAGVLAFYFAVREIFGCKVALLSAVLLAFNFSKVWFSRYPSSETLAQAVAFCAIYLLLVTEKRKGKFLAVVSAFALSQLMLTRIDTALIIFPVLVYVIYTIADSGFLEWRKWFIASMIIFSVFPLVQYAASIHYIAGVVLNLCSAWCNQITTTNLTVIIPMVTAFAILLALGLSKKDGVLRAYQRMGHRYAQALKVLIAFLILAFAAYAYFFRCSPADPNATTLQRALGADACSLIKIAWYTSELGLLLALAGILLMLFSKRRSAALLLLVGFVSTVCFLYVPTVYPDQPWWSRRFLTIVFPFIAVSSAVAMTWIGERARILFKARFLSVLLPVSLALIVLWPSLSMDSTASDYVEYRGALGYLDQVNGMIPRNESTIVVIWDANTVGSRFATPLQYIYGNDVILLGNSYNISQVSSQVDYWKSNGKEVYFINPPDALRTLYVFEYVGNVSVVLKEAVQKEDVVFDGWVASLIFELHVYKVKTTCNQAFVGGTAGGTISGWYQSELTPSYEPGYLWTTGSSVVTLCSPGSGNRYLVLRMDSGRPDSVAPVPVDVFVDGTKLFSSNINSTPAEYRLNYTALPGQDFAVIEISTEVWYPPYVTPGLSSTPPLGIRVMSVEIE